MFDAIKNLKKEYLLNTMIVEYILKIRNPNKNNIQNVNKLNIDLMNILGVKLKIHFKSINKKDFNNYIFISNNKSIIDIIILNYVLNINSDKIKNYFLIDEKHLKNPMYKKLFKKFNNIKIYRSDLNIDNIISDKNNFVIFPEIKIQQNDYIDFFDKNKISLIKQSDKKVIPIYIKQNTNNLIIKNNIKQLDVYIGNELTKKNEIEKDYFKFVKSINIHKRLL